jgi:hypothetical protein
VFCVGHVLWKQMNMSVEHGFHSHWVSLIEGEDTHECYGILLHDRHVATIIHNFW